MKALDVQASITALVKSFSDEAWIEWAKLNDVDLEPQECRSEVLAARSKFPEEVLTSLLEVSLEGGSRKGRSGIRALWSCREARRAGGKCF